MLTMVVVPESEICTSVSMWAARVMVIMPGVNQAQNFRMRTSTSSGEAPAEAASGATR